MQKIKSVFHNIRLQNLLFIFFLSLTPLLWFRKNEIIVGHDNVFALNPIVFLAGRLTTWAEHGFGQSQDLIMGTILIHLFDAIPYMLGFSLQTTERIVYVFWFFMMGLSAYILASTINPKGRVFQLIAILFYQFNFFILQAWWIGERTKFSAYIALPLVLAVFIKVYRGELRVFHGAIINSLIFFIFNAGGLYGIPLYGGMFVAIGIYVIFFSLIEVFNKKNFIVKRLVALTFLSILGYFLVGSYFIFPALSKLGTEYSHSVGQVGGINGLVSWANVISANTSFINLFRLQGIAEWYDNLEHPYAFSYLKNSFLITLSFIFPTLIFLSLFIGGDKEKRRLILYFFLVFLVGIFFSAGTHLPSGFIFEPLMQKIPGFAAAFRSPYYKFAPSLFIAASFLIAFLVDHFKGKIKKALFIAMVVFVLGYHFPYFTGEIFSFKKGFSTRLEVPAYVQEFGKWLNEEKKDQSRILLLPPNDPNLQYSTYDWGYLSYQSLPTLLSNKSVVINNDRLNEDETTIYLLLHDAIRNGDKELTYKLLHLLQIEYFLVQKDKVVLTSSQIPKDATEYEKTIDAFGLPFVKRFGKWYLYKVPSNLQSKIFATNGADVVTGSIIDIRNYFDFAGKNNLFMLDNLGRKDLLTKLNMTRFYTPQCLQCGGRIRPFIRFPERNILPDSVLYPLILLNEERSLHKESPKQVIYDYLGVTLKRISEIKEVVFKGEEITDGIINNYNNALNLIKTNFTKVPEYKDKLRVAEDVSFYLDDEKGVILSIMGVYVAGGENLFKLGNVLQSISSLQNYLKPYLFQYDDINNRFFDVELEESGIYSPYIKLDSFKDAFSVSVSASLTIDGKVRKDIGIDLEKSTSKWASFDKVFLEKGSHSLFLSFPQTPSLASAFKPEKTEFSGDKIGGASCFVSQVSPFSPRKQYKVKTTYSNDFSEALMFYIWEESDKSKQLINSFRLLTNYSQNLFTHVVSPRSDSKRLMLGFCATTLTEDLMKQRVSLILQEFITPSIYVVPEARKDYVSSKVAFTKDSSTKYKVNLSTGEDPVVLVFLERYDKGWTLSGFEGNQFKVGGYANGWVIDKSGEHSLELVYKPQRFFVFGSIISAISVIGGLLFIFWEKIKRRRRHE